MRRIVFARAVHGNAVPEGGDVHVAGKNASRRVLLLVECAVVARSSNSPSILSAAKVHSCSRYRSPHPTVGCSSFVSYAVHSWFAVTGKLVEEYAASDIVRWIDSGNTSALVCAFMIYIRCSMAKQSSHDLFA